MSDIRVRILMGVYNGARYLPQQLASIAAQNHQNWRLIASDDGSQDESSALLAAFGAEVHNGPRQGFSANFMGLIAKFPLGGDWMALSDQDDIWLPDHLERALELLGHDPAPALYCARTWVAETAEGPRKLSRGCPSGTDFRNSLVQCVVAGNTIVANPAAAQLLRRLAPQMPKVPSHDWFAYQLISGAGGRIVFDDQPALIYRQHRGNAMGANNGMGAKWARLKALKEGQLRQWLSQNEAALNVMRPYFTPQAQAISDEFALIRAMPASLQRAAALRKLGIYRQSRSSTALLYLAAYMGWI